MKTDAQRTNETMEEQEKKKHQKLEMDGAIFHAQSIKKA
jgi:hypothetical protein